MRGLALLFVMLGAVLGQTTQGLIQGRVSDTNQQPVASALVTYLESATNTFGRTNTGTDGKYSLQFLSPGTYRLRIESPGYQAQEVHELALEVSARLEIDFTLRPLADLPDSDRSVLLPGNNNLLPYFGPDLHAGRLASIPSQIAKADVLQSALSYVIGSAQLDDLPLSGRNTYALLVTVPGVVTDAISGSANPFAVAGQRPTSSNYLLDGVEHNDYLTTGPFSPAPPEAVQEYRIATTNFSAEFGRTAGYIANAVTRSGTNAWHGLAYFYLGNDVLNANSFSRNAGPTFPDAEYFPNALQKLSRPVPYKQGYVGGRVGGPILRNRLFVFADTEGFRSRTFKDPVLTLVPSTSRLRTCLGSSASPAALGLLDRYPNPFPPTNLGFSSGPCSGSTLAYAVNDPVSVDRRFGLGRIDYRPRDGAQSLTGRVMFSRQWQPDYVYSIYKGLSSPLDINTSSVSLAYTRPFGSGRTNDLRFSWQHDLLASIRPQPTIPTLVSYDPVLVSLPGSAAVYGFSNSGTNVEVNDTAGVTIGKHALSFGGGLLARHASSYLSYGRDGYYVFNSLADFARGIVDTFQSTVARTPDQSSLATPDYARAYTNNQFFGFVQDSWKVSRILNLFTGVRYDYYGSLHDSGPGSVRVLAGPGDNTATRLAGATLDFNGSSKSPYRSDKKDWAPRLGFSLDPFGRGHTVLRGSFGLFYDRPFDNLIQDERYNNFTLLTFFPQPFAFDFLQPASQAVQQLAPRNPPGRSSALYWIDANLQSPLVQKWFLALQQRLGVHASAEVMYIGSKGTDLITTDVVNRRYSQPFNPGLLNPALPQDTVYRANQGDASYHALGAVLRYRSSSFFLQASYTYSHSIDNQSDPLKGDFLDLTTFRESRNPTPSSEFGATSSIAAFTRQFDGSVDRASSDFDQRHNFSAYSLWQVPAAPVHARVLRWISSGWQISQLLGIRSGFPYTVYAAANPLLTPQSGAILFNNRASLVPGNAQKLQTPVSVQGGVDILNGAAFSTPAVPGQIGTLGRNSIAGPGFWTADASVAKSFHTSGRRESQRLQFRADFFNVFNHVNLGNPDPFLSSPFFGRALYGRTSSLSTSLLAAPLQEAPRTIQLQVKFFF